MKCNIVLVAAVILVVTCFVGVSIPPAQASGDVHILSHSSFVTSLNTLYVVGEVENTGDTATEFTKVNATFYDSGNHVIATGIGYSTLDILLPGRKSPFAVMLLEDDGALDVDHYTLEVLWREHEEGKPLGLEILSSSQNIDALDFLHVTGEIKNTGTTTAGSVMLCATFYDAAGTVVGRTWEDADPTDLAPNQTGTFDVELIYSTQIAKVASYSLSAESEDYALIPEFPMLTTLFAGLVIAALAVVVYKRQLTTA